MLIYRCNAPLRIGLAGGGSDVAPYSDIYGGAILNTTISLSASATIEPTNDRKIHFVLADQDKQMIFDSAEQLPVESPFSLHAGVYNRMVKDITGKPLSFMLTTSVDAPPGSGLGTSSTLVVAILGAFAEWLKLPFGE